MSETILEVGHPAASENDFNAHVGPRHPSSIPSCDSAPCGVESGSGAAAARLMKFPRALKIIGIKPPWPKVEEVMRTAKAAMVYARGRCSSARLGNRSGTGYCETVAVAVPRERTPRNAECATGPASRLRILSVIDFQPVGAGVAPFLLAQRDTGSTGFLLRIALAHALLGRVVMVKERRSARRGDWDHVIRTAGRADILPRRESPDRVDQAGNQEKEPKNQFDSETSRRERFNLPH